LPAGWPRAASCYFYELPQNRLACGAQIGILAPHVETFQEKFCKAQHCSESDFGRKVFWRCLHRHALPLAPFIVVFNSGYFSADRELIAHVGRAQTMSEVWMAVKDFFSDPSHSGWWRKRGNVRLSAHRLIVLAKQYLTNGGRPPRIEGLEE